MTILDQLPPEATGLQLARIVGEDLRLCEPVRFTRGCIGVDVVLRRAALSGRVEVGGKIENHFADVLDGEGSLVETVALDAKSYAALKNIWMRCKVQREPQSHD